MTVPGAPRFALPGTWGRIDLTSDATVASSIRKVVERAVGKDERFAGLRSDLRALFRTVADTAREHRAVDFRVAMELAPGVPLPAWLAVFLPRIESTDFAALGLEQLQVALQGGIAGASSAPRAPRESVPGTHVQAVRQAYRRVQAATEEAPELDVLQVDYWLAATEPNRLALLTFSTSYVEFEEQMLELFDAVIRTLRWPAQTPQPA